MAWAAFEGEAASWLRRLISTLCLTFTQAVIVFHILFLVLDKFPLWKIAFSIGCHLIYLVSSLGSLRSPCLAASQRADADPNDLPSQRNFSSSWPMINLTSPSFIGSCVLVLADHFIWFRHFSVIAARARTPIRATGASPYARPTHASYSNGNIYHQGVAFMDVASFFGAGCVPVCLLGMPPLRTPANCRRRSIPATSHLCLVYPALPLSLALGQRQRPAVVRLQSGRRLVRTGRQEAAADHDPLHLGRRSPAAVDRAEAGATDVWQPARRRLGPSRPAEPRTRDAVWLVALCAELRLRALGRGHLARGVHAWRLAARRNGHAAGLPQCDPKQRQPDAAPDAATTSAASERDRVRQRGECGRDAEREPARADHQPRPALARRPGLSARSPRLPNQAEDEQSRAQPNGRPQQEG